MRLAISSATIMIKNWMSHPQAESEANDVILFYLLNLQKYIFFLN
jgi:hypothetical protein